MWSSDAADELQKTKDTEIMFVFIRDQKISILQMVLNRSYSVTTIIWTEYKCLIKNLKEKDLLGGGGHFIVTNALFRKSQNQIYKLSPEIPKAIYKRVLICKLTTWLIVARDFCHSTSSSLR